MSNDDAIPEAEPDPEEVDAAGFVLKMFFPVMFEEAILGASEMQRGDVVREFAFSPLIDWESAQSLFSLADYIRDSGRVDDAAIVLACAKQLLRTILDERSEYHKNGISVQHFFLGTMVSSIGHALNEGFTEYLAKESLDELIATFPDFAEEARQNPEVLHDGTYSLELRLASELVGVVGREAVSHAYFGTLDHFATLRTRTDSILGKGAFTHLLHASDRGDWREAFRIVKRQGNPSTEQEDHET